MRIYLKEWREFRGLLQEELEAKSGIYQTSISRMESRGSASVASIQKLCKALGITPEEIRFPPPTPRPEWLPPQVQLDEILKGTVTVEGVELTDDMKREIVRYARMLKWEAEKGQ